MDETTRATLDCGTVAQVAVTFRLQVWSRCDWREVQAWTDPEDPTTPYREYWARMFRYPSYETRLVKERVEVTREVQVVSYTPGEEVETRVEAEPET